MKAKAILLSAAAALGGCPLLDVLERSEPTPICRASDLTTRSELAVLDDPALVVHTCEITVSLARDKNGQTFARTLVDRWECDLRKLANAPRSVAARACIRQQ